MTGRGTVPSEIPADEYDVVVFENRFPFLGCSRPTPDPGHGAIPCSSRPRPWAVVDAWAECAVADGMDQSATLSCQEGHALLLDCRDGSIAQVPFDPSADAWRCSSSTLAPNTPWRMGSTLPGAAAARTPHGGWGFVRCTSMRDDFEISCVELDLAVDTATAHGALGARMTGGEIGRSAIALMPTGRAAAVTAAVIQAFADKGFGPPRCFEVTAGGPARRES